jgi:prolyl-tRNA editing enzyme YbaK/EbsC (Cys-tRNA(Pro) deacylase)
MSESGSVGRVRGALLAAGLPDTITAFPAGTRTAEDAAAAVGCSVAQIAKSIVFRAGERAVVVIASGAESGAVT